MTTILEQSPKELERMVEAMEHGEEVVITRAGQPVAQLTAVSSERQRRLAWLERLDRLRASIGTGKTDGPTTEEIIDDLRSERG